MLVIPTQALDHELLNDYVKLTDVALRSATEPQAGLYIAESLKVLERALRAGHKPKSVLTIPGWLEKLTALCAKYPEATRETPVFVAEPSVIEQITGFLVHRGTLASMQRPPLPSLSEVLGNVSRVVILEDIVDHTNVGAIFRSVAALGADAVIISESCADPLYRRSVRVSMGTVLQIPWTRAGDWKSLTNELTMRGFHIAALALHPSAVTLEEFAAKKIEKVALVVGSEGDGLSPRALSAADTVVTIPMSLGVDSLNVAAASAVALWALRHTP
jgi:tRNA G18 (ribose-2'-O)-methylase SpoU